MESLSSKVFILLFIFQSATAYSQCELAESPAGPPQWITWTQRIQKEAGESFATDHILKVSDKNILRVCEDPRRPRHFKFETEFNPKSHCLGDVIPPDQFKDPDGKTTLLKESVEAAIAKKLGILFFKQEKGGRFHLRNWRRGPCHVAFFKHNPEPITTAQIHLFSSPKTKTLADSRGGQKIFKQIGELRFQMKSRSRTLELFEPWLEEGVFHYTLFFRDESNGSTTYGAGRFLDIESKQELKNGAKIPLDFNFSYNPACAQSSQFACPIGPTRFDFEILAGERNPPSH